MINPVTPMASLLLAIYLVLTGLNYLVDLELPGWVIGIFALAAGVLMLRDRFAKGGAAK